jgi:murein DD-endopeptidase MepM/ murein hydrolase activator NlpD
VPPTKLSPVPSARRIRLLATALGVVVLAAVPAGGAQSIYDRQNQLNEKIADLRDAIVAAEHKEGVLSSDIQAAGSQIDALEGDIGALSQKIARLERDLAAHRARLARLQDLFDEQTRELDRLRGEYATAQRILETRLVQLYQQGEADSFEVLLQMQSLGDLLDQVEYFDSVGRQDQAISNQIRTLKTEMRIARVQTRATKTEVAKATAVLADETAQQVAARAELLARQQALASARASQQGMLASVRSQRHDTEEDLAQMQAASAAIAATIRAQTGSSGSSGSGVSSSGLVWPVNGVVTSGFGMRWGRMHEGIDIAAPCGTTIRAAAAGTVIYAGWMDGYGNITVIDHGNGLATAYAHQSAIYAGGGVSQGQAIGAVGSTGHSTGCHLHFEVRVNGSPVDPMGYL